jgi:hypothetical protein
MSSYYYVFVSSYVSGPRPKAEADELGCEYVSEEVRFCYCYICPHATSKGVLIPLALARCLSVSLALSSLSLSLSLSLYIYIYIHTL